MSSPNNTLNTQPIVWNSTSDAKGLHPTTSTRLGYTPYDHLVAIIRPPAYLGAKYNLQLIRVGGAGRLTIVHETFYPTLEAAQKAAEAIAEREMQEAQQPQQEAA